MANLMGKGHLQLQMEECLKDYLKMENIFKRS